MKASELIKELQNLVAIHGDLPMAIDDGLELRALGEVDAVEEDEAIVLWWESKQ